MKLGADFSLTNPEWCILWQFFGFGDPNDGSRNPWMPITAKNGRLYLYVRGDNTFELQGNKDYQYKSGDLDLGAIVTGVWELFELRLRYDWTPLGTTDEVGNGWFNLSRNSDEKVNIINKKVGFNDAFGSVVNFGIYHNYDSTSIANNLEMFLGPVRLEKLS